MKTVEIPGGVAHLREDHEIRTRDKRLVEVAAIVAAYPIEKLAEQMEAGPVSVVTLRLDADEATALYKVRDAGIVASIVSWTLDDPIPTMDTIGDLDPDLYKALDEAVKALGATVAAGVDFDPPDPTSPGFAESPTVPSADSEGDSKADSESDSTQQQPSDGTSTSIAASSPDSLTTST